MRILILEHLLPAPLDSGAKIKTYYTIKALASKHELLMLSYVRTEEECAYLGDLESAFGRVELVPLARNKWQNATDALGSLLRRDSFIVSRDFRPHMRDAFRKAVDEFRPDAIHIDHLQMAQFVDSNIGCPTVLDQHNVESTIVRRIAETSTSPLSRAYASVEWPKLKRFELEACGKCDLVLTVSEEDKLELQSQDPSLRQIETLPIGIDTDFFHAVDRDVGSKNILFLGTMYWPPNVDSVQYFHQDILPIIKHSIPDCQFTIAGQRPTKSVLALQSDESVVVTGYVDDVRDIAKNCGAFVVPLRAGSGVRVKILNAMSMGLPIVSTSVGAEGIEAKPGEHILIADSPEDFAEAVVKLLTDHALAQRLGHNARQLACEKYSWETTGKRVLELYDTHIAPKTHPVADTI